MFLGNFGSKKKKKTRRIRFVVFLYSDWKHLSHFFVQHHLIAISQRKFFYTLWINRQTADWQTVWRVGVCVCVYVCGCSPPDTDCSWQWKCTCLRSNSTNGLLPATRNSSVLMSSSHYQQLLVSCRFSCCCRCCGWHPCLTARKF